jgi:2,4-didehydro-3-deoxy-L-rhamnonate hydrolase
MPPRESSPVKIANVSGRLSLVGDEGGIDVERASAGRFGPDPQASAWDHVAGVTVGQDLSERVAQMSSGGQFSLGKSFPGFGPSGPWLVPPDGLGDPDDLELGCSVDGCKVQNSRTSQLVFCVPELIARLSAVLPLLPGDLIFTGTPAGIGATRQPPQFLRPGQVLNSYIEGVGTLADRLIAPPA